MKGVDADELVRLALERGGSVTPVNGEVLGVARKDRPSRRKRKPKAPPVEADNEPREPGSVICHGTILGRAVPWKAPTVSRAGGVVHGRDYKRFVAWQAEVRRQAAPLMGRRRPYGGPVALEMTFYLNPRGGTPPDPTNLQKSTEDAMQGILFVNDRQVQEVTSRRVVDRSQEQRVEFVVRAI